MKKPKGYDLIAKAKTPFTIRVQGHCLDPIIAHDDRLIIDPREPVKLGDYVMVVFNPSVVREDGLFLQVKYLWSMPAVGLERLPFRPQPDDIVKNPALGLEMLNPPMKCYAELRHLAAVFKVVEVQKVKPSPNLPGRIYERDPNALVVAAGE